MQTDFETTSEMMGGVSIQQVKPVAQKTASTTQHKSGVSYVSRPPRPHNYDTVDSEAHTLPNGKNSFKGKKTERRPTSSFVTAGNAATKKRINQNVVGLKDLLFKGGDFVSNGGSSNGNGGLKKQRLKSSQGRGVNLELPINNI